MKRLLILLFVLISLGSFGQGRIVVKVPVAPTVDTTSLSNRINKVQQNLQDTAGALRSAISAASALPTLSTLTDGATVTWDYSTQGTEAKVTLAGNRTLSITNLPAGEVVYLTLEVIQDATGSRTLTLPASTKVIGGGAGAITLTTTGGATDLLTFRWNGTTLFANLGTNYN
jgi:hypothetical protein